MNLSFVNSRRLVRGPNVVSPPRVDATGKQYAVAKDGALRRVVVNEDGVFHVTKWSKARRKTERRAKRQRTATAQAQAVMEIAVA